MKKKIIVTLLISMLFGNISLFANGSFEQGYELAKQYNIKASSKAQRQWKKIFKKNRRLKLMGISKLNDDEKRILLKYLIENAADSEQSTVPGQ